MKEVRRILFAAVASSVAFLSQGNISLAQVNGKIDNVDFKLKFNGRLNMDLGTFLGADDHKANRNGCSINDCRLGVIADFDSVWQAKLEVSYSGKNIAFRDVYLKRTFKNTGSEVQLGNFFFPFGYKRAGLGYKFVDTAPSDAAFAPSRKMGVGYQSFANNLNWGLGFFSDGNVDDGKETNKGYSFNAYALLRPILTSSEVLHFTASGILTHPAASVSFSAPMPLMFTSFPLIKTGKMEAYNYGRLEVAVLGIVRRFYAEARFLKAWVNTPNEVLSVVKGADGNDVAVATPQDNYDGSYGFFVQATWRVTGENQGYNKKTGLATNPQGRAFELLARFDRTDFDQFGSVNNITVGANYHFNKYLRARLNYVHASIKGGADVDAICSRVQFSF